MYAFQLKKLSKAKACADTGLLDTNMLERCLTFYSAVSEYLLAVMSGRVANDG